MALRAPFSSPEQVLLVTTAVVNYNQKAPFTTDSPCQLSSAASQTVYGANHPGPSDATKYASVKPGVLAADTNFTFPTALGTLHSVAAAALTDANRMRVIVIKNKTIVLKRMGNDINVGAGEFRENGTTLQFGDALIASDDIEIISLAAAEITTLTGGATTAGRIYDSKSYSFMTATGPANFVSAL